MADSPWRQLLVTLGVSLLTWLGWFVFTTLDNKRKDELEFVRSQIVDLYGPMYTLTEADETVWKRLTDRMPRFDPNAPPSDAELTKWRALIKQVVLPLTDQMEKTFLSGKQVVRCEKTREALQKVVVFTESVRLLASTWADNDFSDRTKEGNVPGQRYPDSLPGLLLKELDGLHERQQKLGDGFSGLFLGRYSPACPDGDDAQSDANAKKGQAPN